MIPTPTPITAAGVFGTVAPGPGQQWGINPVAGISTIIIFTIQTFLIGAAISALVYMLWGAYEYTTAGGDPEWLAKARQKMTNAVIGLVLTLVVLGIFLVVTSDVLKIIKRGPKGEWIFALPTINKCLPIGNACTPSGQACCGTPCDATLLRCP